MPVKRIHLVPVNSKEYGDEYNLNIELFINENARPSGRMTSFGSMGGLAAKSQTEPFLLMADGDMDFGSYFEQYRFATSNLMSGRPFIEGELFTINYEEEDIIYRVAKIYDPA